MEFIIENIIKFGIFIIIPIFAKPHIFLDICKNEFLKLLVFVPPKLDAENSGILVNVKGVGY